MVEFKRKVLFGLMLLAGVTAASGGQAAPRAVGPIPALTGGALVQPVHYYEDRRYGDWRHHEWRYREAGRFRRYEEWHRHRAWEHRHGW